MNEQSKLCPFRRGADGAFLTCHGDRCMAYLEFDQPVLSLHGDTGKPPVHVTMCRMMSYPAYYSGGCAV